jgi:hypothetical protein
MSDRLLESLPTDIERPATRAADLASDLAWAVATRVRNTVSDVEALVRSMSLDPNRVAVEYAYLLIAITQFCIDAGIGDRAAREQLSRAFESAVLSVKALPASERGLPLRRHAYGDALSNPHPDFGRAYSVGRVFARYCDAGPDVAVIEFGARTYMEQLPPMLGRLRSLTVV